MKTNKFDVNQTKFILMKQTNKNISSEWSFAKILII